MAEFVSNKKMAEVGSLLCNPLLHCSQLRLISFEFHLGKFHLNFVSFIYELFQKSCIFVLLEHFVHYCQVVSMNIHSFVQVVPVSVGLVGCIVHIIEHVIELIAHFVQLFTILICLVIQLIHLGVETLAPFDKGHLLMGSHWSEFASGRINDHEVSFEESKILVWMSDVEVDVGLRWLIR